MVYHPAGPIPQTYFLEGVVYIDRPDRGGYGMQNLYCLTGVTEHVPMPRAENSSLYPEGGLGEASKSGFPAKIMVGGGNIRRYKQCLGQCG